MANIPVIPEPPRPQGRPSVQRDRVANYIRRRVVQGKLRPGDRIPTRRELAERLGVDLLTAQQAMKRLLDQGFLQSRGRQGTFVTANPPHLVRYAVVFPSHPDHSGRWNGFWRALRQSAEQLPDAADCKLRLFYNCDGHSDQPDYHRLVRDLRANRIAGILFASSPHLLSKSPLITTPNVPRVSIGGPTDVALGASPVTFPLTNFITTALQQAITSGRRRVAVLTVPAVLANWERSLTAYTRAGRLETHPQWLQSVPPSDPICARSLMRLLMNPDQKVRPDALIITDDNLVEQATHGLADLDVRVPDDLLVTAHANFPLAQKTHVPIRRLGYDARQVLALCLGELNRQRQGGQVHGIKTIACWENETQH